MDMETYKARLASYSSSYPATKKRTSDTRSTTRKLKWPHVQPAPAQLAQAGFYYSPTSSCPDNVTCFLCNCSIVGWELDDDPFAEHLKHSKENCGWAVVAGIEHAIENGDRDIEDPTAPSFIEARRATFRDAWPHENKRGWTCKITKMIDAGWYYSPTSESDDFVRCCYCSLGLDGWEPKDDPYKEHQRRSPDCLFIRARGALTNRPPGKRKGRMSKASRMSAQPSLLEEGTNMDAPETAQASSMIGDLDTHTTAMNTDVDLSIARKTKTASKKSTRQSVQKRQPQSKNLTAIEPEDDDFSIKLDSQNISYKPDAKRKSDQIEGDLDPGDSVATLPSRKRRVTRSRQSKQSQKLQSEKDKKGRKRATSKGRDSTISSLQSPQLASVGLDDQQLEDAISMQLDQPMSDEELLQDDGEMQKAIKNPARTKAKKDAKAKPSAQQVKAARKKATEAAPVNPPEHTSRLQENESGQSEEAIMTAPKNDGQDSIPESPKPAKGSKKKSTKKEKAQKVPKKTRVNKKTAAVDQQEEHLPEVEGARPAEEEGNVVGQVQADHFFDVASIHCDEQYDDFVNGLPQHLDDASDAGQYHSVHEYFSAANISATTRQASASRDIPSEARTLIASPESSQKTIRTNEVHTETTDQLEHIEGKASTHALGLTSQDADTTPATNKISSKIDAPGVGASPMASQISSPGQASDAENVPPSHMPSTELVRAEAGGTLTPSTPRAARIPLAPRTPTCSPMKRLISGLQSNFPWTAIDLDHALLGDIAAEATAKADGVSVAQQQRLSSPEKKLSVEEWIRFKAQGAEEKVRAECEQIVDRFEAQGEKAMKSLEGIVCLR